MSDLDLTKLREIAEAATDGPWNLHTLRTDETHDMIPTRDNPALHPPPVRDAVRAASAA